MRREKGEGEKWPIKGNETSWRELFLFSVRVVKLCQVLDERTGVGRTLSRQLLRSGTSIGANVEEAQADQSHADFLAKYSIALKEARETYYWLRLVAECKLVPATRLGEITQECNELVGILTTIVKNSRSES